jgi:hypothetical protein
VSLDGKALSHHEHFEGLNHVDLAGFAFASFVTMSSLLLPEKPEQLFAAIGNNISLFRRCHRSTPFFAYAFPY